MKYFFQLMEAMKVLERCYSDFTVCWSCWGQRSWGPWWGFRLLLLVWSCGVSVWSTVAALLKWSGTEYNSVTMLTEECSPHLWTFGKLYWSTLGPPDSEHAIFSLVNLQTVWIFKILVCRTPLTVPDIVFLENTFFLDGLAMQVLRDVQVMKVSWTRQNRS